MRELMTCRSMAGTDTPRRDEPARAQQLDFWLESAVFWIVQLQIADQEGNPASYSEALNKAQESLDRLQTLLAFK